MSWRVVVIAAAALGAAACSSSNGGSSGSSSSGAGSASGGTNAGASTGGSSGSGGSSSSGGGSGTSTGGSTGSATLFPPDAPWYQDVSGPAHLAAESSAIIGDLAASGGWGNGNVLQIDFSITLQHATATTEYVSWNTTGDWYSPDCDHQPMPVPAGGALEGESGYACASDGDCHLLVIDDAHHTLYEMWRANQVSASDFEGGCQAVWDLSKHYPDNLRGDGCTSADAAGFPISALLFTADEVAAGHIDHAIRFILPNDRIRSGVYVHPSTHTTPATSGDASAPPYGVRLRLRADYPVDSLPSEGAKVVARALQKYGMFLSDGGQIALTAADDRFTTAKWAGLLDAHDLSALSVSDFEVVDLGAAQPAVDCARNP